MLGLKRFSLPWHRQRPNDNATHNRYDIDTDNDNKRHSKDRSSSISSHHSASSTSSNSMKRSREDSTAWDKHEPPSKRRSPSPKEETLSGLRVPILKPKITKSQAGRKSLPAMSHDPSDEEHKIVLSLANQLAFHTDEQDAKKIFARHQADTRRKKEAHKAEFEVQLQEKKRLLEESLRRQKEDKNHKKKRLAAQRRKIEREASEKSFSEALKEYNEYLETVKRVGEVRISDDEGLEEAVDKDGRKIRIGERKVLPPTPQLPFIATLSDHWESKVVDALGVRSDTTILARSVEGVEISRKDIGRLLPPGKMLPGREPWLNDEVINAWYANLCARLNEKDGYVKGPNNTPKWVAYSTAWYKNVSERGAQSIANWSRRKGIKNEKLLQTERIFFPTNSGAHWTILTVSGKNRTIEYLDSLNEHGYQSRKYINMATAWLKMELGSKFEESEWTVLHTKSALQTNTNDCGVFACLNGLALVKGVEDPSMEFGADDIPLGRRMFIATLLNGGFKGDFDL